MKLIVNRERIEPFLHEIGLAPGMYIDDIDENHIMPIIHAHDLAPRDIAFKSTFHMLRHLFRLKDKTTKLFLDYELDERIQTELFTILCYMVAFKNKMSDYGTDSYFQDKVRLNLLKAYSILQRNAIDNIVVEIRSRGSDEKATLDNLQHYFPIEKNILKPISAMFPLSVMANPKGLETIGITTLKTYNDLLNGKIRIPKVRQMIERLEEMIEFQNKKSEKMFMLKSAITLTIYLNFSGGNEQGNKSVTFRKNHLILIYKAFQILDWKMESQSNVKKNQKPRKESRVDNAAYKRFDQALRQYIKDNP